MSTSGLLVNWLYHSFWLGLDWLFPPQCAGCGKTGKRWCVSCQRKVKVIGSSVCPICGQLQNDTTICTRCRDRKPHYSRLRSWAVFGGEIRLAIHHLKYHRNIALGEIFSHSLVRVLSMQRWLVDIVVPVPLALERLSERGYNQASLLARPLAMRLHLPYNPGALSRLRETRTQIGLTAGERRANVFGAFVARSPLVQGKNILVIDDVTTTGSTMDACAFALLDAGAGQVYCLTLAQASQHTENQPY